MLREALFNLYLGKIEVAFYASNNIYIMLSDTAGCGRKHGFDCNTFGGHTLVTVLFCTE